MEILAEGYDLPHEPYKRLLIEDYPEINASGCAGWP